MSSFKHIVAVASGKGGVGKSTVTAWLGLAAAEAGKNVGIIDADLHGCSIPRILGLEGELHYEDDDILYPGQAGGMRIASLGYFAQDNPIIWRVYSQALRKFLEDFQWGDLDLLLIDLPPGTGDMPLNVMQNQNLKGAAMVVVTTPQPTAAVIAGRVAVMAEKMNVRVLGVVENMAWFQCSVCGQKHYIFGSGGGVRLAGDLNAPVLGQLPMLPEMREQADAGQLELSDEFRQVFARMWSELE